MKYVPIKEILGTEKLKNFIAVARHYCALIDDERLITPEVFLPKMLRILLELYPAALNLDLVDLQSNEEYEITKIDLQAVLLSIAGRIGNNRYYWSVFDPTSMDETDAVCDDLLDDFGDIYKHLNYSLRIFDLQAIDSQEIAVWEFKFDFMSHWSNHCINAIRALHYFIQRMEKASN